MGRFATVSQPDFLGLNESSSPQQVHQLELVRATNCWRYRNAFGTRPGLQHETVGYTGQIASATTIEGIHEYRSRVDGTGALVVVTGGQVQSALATTLTKVGVTITGGQNNVWTFAEHNNRVYAAGGADGDSIWYWDGSAGSVTPVVFRNAAAADIDAKYVFEKWNYGFLAGMNGVLPEDNPMIIRYSALGDMTLWPAGNTIGGTSTIGGLSSYGDEYTTGLADFTDNQGDWLLVLTNKRLYSVAQAGSSVAPFYVDSEIQNGCVNQRAFVSLGLDSGEAIYLSEQGIHSLRQSQQHGNAADRFLSWKIRETFATLNKSRLKYACGAYWPEHGIVAFAVSTGSNTVNDTVLVLDVRGVNEITADTARWYIWKTQASLNGNCLVSARDTTGKRFLYLGNTTGRVVRFQSDDHRDLTTTYSVDFQTKHDDHGDSSMHKGPGDLFVSVIGNSPSYSPKVRPVFDYGTVEGSQLPIEIAGGGSLWDGFAWNSGTWGTRENITLDKVYCRGSGYTVGFRFTHNGPNEPFWIAGFHYQLRRLGEATGQAA